MAANKAEMLYKIQVDAAKAVKDMEAVAGKVRDINTQAANSGKAVGGFQRTIQNTSYQLQDFIVQTSMGTDALRAFGQQAPQLLGSFGAIGAAIGVVAALSPVVIQLFKEMSKEAKTFDEAIKGADDALKLLKETFSFADRASFDTLIESYKKANVETRKLILSNMELNMVIAKVAANDLQDSLLNSLDAGVKKLGFFNRALLETNKYLKDNEAAAKAGSINPFAAKAAGMSSQALLGEGFGISDQQLNSLQEAQKLLNASKISATEFLDAVSKVYIETKKPTKDFTAWVQELQKTVTKTKELELQQQQYADAVKRLNSGDYSTSKSLEDSAKARDKELDAIVKEFEALEKLSESRKKEAEALMRSIDPLSSHTQALERAKVLYNDNKLSAEEYARAVDFANRRLADSDPLIRGAGQSLSNAMTDIAFSGKGMNDVMNDMVESLAKVAYQVMIVQPLIDALKGSMAAAGMTWNPSAPTYGPPVTAMPNANGNAFAGGSVVPFAKGGVVSSPMLFPMSGGQTGLMGEAGPEAIMPLKRGKDGKLGVAAGGSSTQVNIYNSNGGEVTTQERQDPNGGKIIDIMIKKAVASGIASGDFDKAMGSTYGLRRQGTR
jgi:hypothetical protein